MRRTLKKANRQIRETIDHLLDGQGYGFVVLAMNQFRSLRPELVGRMVNELLQQEFSSIKGFIVCTPGRMNATDHSSELGYVCLCDVEATTPLSVEMCWRGTARRWCEFACNGGHR